MKIFDADGHLLEGSISATVSRSVEGDIAASSAGPQAFQRVGGCETEVVMRVNVDFDLVFAGCPNRTGWWFLSSRW